MQGEHGQPLFLSPPTPDRANEDSPSLIFWSEGGNVRTLHGVFTLPISLNQTCSSIIVPVFIPSKLKLREVKTHTKWHRAMQGQQWLSLLLP